MAVHEIEIAGRKVGPAHPPYVVAELSANHNGSLERALEHIRVARECGADAVKLQTYTADTLTLRSDRPDFRIKGGLWDGYTLHDLYQEAHTPWEWHEALFLEGRRCGITVFSSPFDGSAVDLLERLGAPAHKIASFEIVDLELIARAASTRKPLIISTGMANLGEIQEAVDVAREHGNGELVLLHCVSAYPAPAKDANVLTIPHMQQAFGTLVGLSDHTMGTAVACAAVALGACVVEKHFILSRSDGGPDSAFSLEPGELKQLVGGCRTAWEARGEVTYKRQASESANLIFRRSLYITRDLEAGEEFTRENVRAVRPGYGLPPKFLSSILGRRARRKLAFGTRLTWDEVE